MNGFPELTLEDFGSPKTADPSGDGGFPTLTLEDFNNAKSNGTTDKTRTGSQTPGLESRPKETVSLRNSPQDGLGSVNAEEKAVALPGDIQLSSLAGTPYVEGASEVRKAVPLSNWDKVLNYLDLNKQPVPELRRSYGANALEAAGETLHGFIPRSAGAAAQLLTPAASSPEAIKQGYQAVTDWVAGKPIGQIIKERIPESQTLVEADKTPPGSKERFKAGLGMMANMAMAAGLSRGLAERPLVQETPVTAAEKPAEAVANAPESPVAIPEPQTVAEQPPAQTQAPELTDEDFAGPALTPEVLAQMGEEQPALYFSEQKSQQLPVAEEQPTSDIQGGIYEGGATERQGTGTQEPVGSERAQLSAQGQETAPMAEESARGTQPIEHAYNLSQHISRQVAAGQPDSVIEAAQAAALDNARGSISQTGRFNQDFMVKSAMRAAGRESARLAESMDKPIGEGETDTLHDIVPSDTVPPDRAVAHAERLTKADQLLSELPERDQQIVRGVSMEGRTIDDMASELGISHQRVSQLHTRALDTLRRRMREAEEGLRTSRMSSLAEPGQKPYLLPDELREAFTPTGKTTETINRLNREFGHVARISEVAASPEARASALRSTTGGADLLRKLSDAESLAQKIGLKVSWYKTDVPIDLAGAHLEGQREIAINIDSLANNDPLHIIAAHEVGHGLKTLHPELWSELARQIKENAVKNPEALKAYRDRLTRNGYKESRHWDELTADAVADALKNPGRFAEAIGRPRLASRVLAAIHDLLSRIMDKFRSAPEPKTASAMAGEAMSDIGRMRASVMDAFQKANDHAQAIDIVSEHQNLDLALKQGRIDPSNPMSKLVNLTKEITEGADVVDIASRVFSEQKSNDIRMEFDRNPKDLNAMGFIVDTGRDRAELQKARELIATSKSPKLAKEFLPVVDHAIENFDRLSKTKTSYDIGLARQSELENMTGAAAHGRVANYISHFFEEFPEEAKKGSFLAWFDNMARGGGMTRYFTKSREFASMAEAIHAGKRPLSTNLADLAQIRLGAGQRLILQQKFIDNMTRMRDKDGGQVLFRAQKDAPRGYVPVTLANGLKAYAHPKYADLIKQLYSESAIRRTAVGRAALKISGVSKALTLGLDTYHAANIAFRGAAYGKGMGRFGYGKGLSLLEYSNEGIETALKRGEITPAQARYARAHKPMARELVGMGLQVGRWTDNLLGEKRFHFPGLSKASEWIFQKEGRGMLMQAAIANAERNIKRFPELGRRGAMQKTVREMNQVFGNLGRSSIFSRDATLRDAAQITFLAPQWWESQLRAEFRGMGQLSMTPVDVLRGKFRMGAVAQGQATALLATFAAYQLANYATTGHSTFENKEGHKTDLYLPVGHGLFISPFWMFKYTDQFTDLMKQGKSIPGAAGTMVSYKFHKLPAAAYTLLTGRTRFGPQPRTQGQVYKASLAEAAPVPIMLSGMAQPDPKQALGYKFGVQSDDLLKQGLMSFGVHAQKERPPSILRPGSRQPRRRNVIH